MKKTFVFCLIIILFLNISCETNNDELNLMTSYKLNSNYSEYDNLMDGFIYDSKSSDTELIQEFEIYFRNYYNLKSPVTIDEYAIQNILNTPQVVLTNSNYSLQFKTDLNSLLNGTTTLVEILKNTPLNSTEIQTLEICDGIIKRDPHWKDRKTIAFTYGSQTNEITGYFYSGIIEILSN